MLAWLLLKERLRKIQFFGVIIALSGFFATVSKMRREEINIRFEILNTFLPLSVRVYYYCLAFFLIATDKSQNSKKTEKL
jgi:hypothetical protein